MWRGCKRQTGLSPSLMLYSKRPTCAPPLVAHLEATTQGHRGPNFQCELISIHSPLLIESCLVSCPPLTHMLKFSGFAHLASRLDNKASWLIVRGGIFALHSTYNVLPPSAHRKKPTCIDVHQICNRDALTHRKEHSHVSNE